MLSCSVTKSCLTLCDPLDYSPPGSLPMGFPKQEYWSGWPFPSPGDLPDPGLNSRLLHCQVDFFFFFFLTTEPPTALCLAQHIFPIGEILHVCACSVMCADSLQRHGLWPTRLLCSLNLDLPHCRQILYHLNHQGSPKILL